jgi:hypothetical protein
MDRIFTIRLSITKTQTPIQLCQHRRHILEIWWQQQRTKGLIADVEGGDATIKA